MPRRYAITATVGRVTGDGWASVRQIPTFYLDSDVQGVTSTAHAEQVAKWIIDPYDNLETYVTAVEV